MNDQLQGQLATVIAQISSAMRTAGDFAIEQLPEIAQSYIVYGRLYTTIVTALFIALTALLAFVALRKGFFNPVVDHHGSWTEGRLFAAIAGTIGTFIASCMTLFALKGALLVWLAPKVWLIQELARLLK